jgi:hypothetical protein
MHATQSIQTLEQRIKAIQGELTTLGEMRPGSLTQQYSVCGKPHCRCKDPDHPQRHGPYWKLSYAHRGKNATEFIRGPSVPTVKRQLATYKRFRKLTDQWVDLALKLAKLKSKLTKE